MRPLDRQLHPPHLPPDLVERRRLSTMSELLRDYRLVLVHAPAGSGKTTLLAQWHALLSEEGHGVIWFSPNANDKNPDPLASYLLVALNASHGSTADIPEQPRDTVELLQSVLKDLCRNRPLFVFLDDFHLLDDPQSARAVASLIAARVPGLTFVIASRTRPQLPLSRYRVDGIICELAMDEMQFSSEETQAFFTASGIGPLPDAIRSQVDHSVEGWVAGLRLISLAIKKQNGSIAVSEALKGGNRNFVDYFLHEVLEGLPQETQAFLVRTSFLDNMSPDLCNAVTGQTDAGKILDSLDEAKLFVTTLPGTVRWYRYHHLFQEFLRNRLYLQDGAVIALLHRRAALWYLETGNPLEAVSHAFSAKDPAWAAEIIEQGCLYDYLSFGRFETYAKWMQQLPQDARENRPLLQFLFVWRLINRRRFSAASQILDRIERRLSARDAAAEPWIAPAELNISGRLQLMRALIGAYSGDLAEARRQIDPVADQRLDDLAFGQRDLDSICSYISYHEGDLDAAARLTWKAHKEYRDISCHWGVIHSLCIAALVCLERGQVDDAGALVSNAMETASGYFSEQSYMQALCRALLGQVLMQSAQPDRAEFEWSRLFGPDWAIDLTGLPERYLIPAIGLSRLYDASGRSDLASSLLASVSKQVLEAEDPGAAFALTVEQCNRAFRYNDIAQGRRAFEYCELLLPDVRRRYTCDHWVIWTAFAQADARLKAAGGHIQEAKDSLSAQIAKAEHDNRICSMKLLSDVLNDIGSGRSAASCVAAMDIIGVRNKRPAMQAVDGDSDVQQADHGSPEHLRESRLWSRVMQYGLSHREYDVVLLMLDGLTNPQIARRLNIGVNTVKTHVSNVFNKLGVNNRTMVALKILK